MGKIIDIDTYITSLSTIKYSNIFITKLGLMQDNPNQYYEYIPNERHDYCLQYVTSGEGVFYTNGVTYKLQKNDLFLLPKSRNHYYKANPDNPYNYYWIHFNGSGFDKYLSLIGLSDSSPVIHNLNNEEIVKTFSKLIEISKKNANINQLRLLSLGYELLYLLASETILQERNDADIKEELCNDITNYIVENFKKPLTLDHIAKNFSMDKYYILRIYKKITGFTPIQFLINYRIEYSCFLLKQGYPVNEVAFMCGFNDIPNFSVRFKKVVGTSPAEFKKQQT